MCMCRYVQVCVCVCVCVVLTYMGNYEKKHLHHIIFKVKYKQFYIYIIYNIFYLPTILKLNL